MFLSLEDCSEDLHSEGIEIASALALNGFILLLEWWHRLPLSSPGWFRVILIILALRHVRITKWTTVLESLSAITARNPLQFAWIHRVTILMVCKASLPLPLPLPINLSFTFAFLIFALSFFTLLLSGFLPGRRMLYSPESLWRPLTQLII